MAVNSLFETSIAVSWSSVRVISLPLFVAGALWLTLSLLVTTYFPSTFSVIFAFATSIQVSPSNPTTPALLPLP
jgi:hypothetical protein